MSDKQQIPKEIFKYIFSYIGCLLDARRFNIAIPLDAPRTYGIEEIESCLLCLDSGNVQCARHYYLNDIFDPSDRPRLTETLRGLKTKSEYDTCPYNIPYTEYVWVREATGTCRGIWNLGPTAYDSFYTPPITEYFRAVYKVEIGNFKKKLETVSWLHGRNDQFIHHMRVDDGKIVCEENDYHPNCDSLIIFLYSAIHPLFVDKCSP
jgi:hypothetical protein